MKREAIERLAMDWAGGELSDDAANLLSEYLAEHPEANIWAEEIRQIYQVNQLTIKQKSPHIVIKKAKPFKAMRRFLFGKRLSIARWAAVWILAISIGFIVGRRQMYTKISEIPISNFTVAQVRNKSMLDLETKHRGGFWAEKISTSLERQDYSTPLKLPKHKCFWPKLKR